MMDLTLDSKQSEVLDCSSCDPQKMRIRNCLNKWGKSNSPIQVNGNVYWQCPRSMVVDNWEIGYLISLYFECREQKTSPFGGTLMNTTAFCKSVFDLLDNLVSDYRKREAKKAEEKQKREAAKQKAESKRKR